MSQIRGILATFAAGAFLFSLGAHAQDEQSLGDVAASRGFRKQQKNSEASKDSVPAPASTDAPGKPTPKKDPSSKDSSPKAANAPKVKKVITTKRFLSISVQRARCRQADGRWIHSPANL